MPTMEVLETREKAKSSTKGTCLEDITPDLEDMKPTKAVMVK